MKKSELLAKIKDALQAEKELVEDMELAGIEEWDSLSVLAMISLFDRLFSITVKYGDIRKFKTIKDLISIAEDKLD